MEDDLGRLYKGLLMANVVGSSIFNRTKKEVKKMGDVKSRYEVISELEEQKREYIQNADILERNLRAKEKELKDLKRKVEDKAEEIADFKEQMKTAAITNQQLIKSIDDSLKRFETLAAKEKK